MNLEEIPNHVASVSLKARQDMVAGHWDEVMTDALYKACGAETREEMAEARECAEIAAFLHR